MKIKSFNSYFAEAAVAQDYVAPKDKDDEATEYKPRSKGEQDFKDAHKVEKIKHPVAGDNQFDGSIEGKVGGHGSPEDHVGGKKQADGEDKPVMQGSSKVNEDIERTADVRMVKVHTPDGRVVMRKMKKIIHEDFNLDEAKIDLDGVELIMGNTKNAQEAEKEVAKAFKVSPAKAKSLVQQVMKRASKK